MNSSFPPASTPSAFDQLIFSEGYARVADEIAAFPDSEIVTIYVEITQAVTSTLGRVGRLRQLRAEIVATVPSFNIVRYDKLGDYAMGLWCTHNGHLNTVRPSASLQQLYDGVVERRALFIADLSGLVKRGLVRYPRLSQLKGPTGHRPSAEELTALIAVFREHWSVIEGKTAVTLEELHEAEAEAGRLVLALGMREGTLPSESDSARLRQRAFSLFWHAHFDARRVVMFLRPHGNDADEILPSLYAGRANGRRKEEDESSAPTGATPTEPAQPAGLGSDDTESPEAPPSGVTPLRVA